MPSRRLHTIASGSAFNLLPTKVWKQEKEKLLVMLSSKTTPFLSSNQGKTSHTKFDMCKKCAKNIFAQENKIYRDRINCFKVKAASKEEGPKKFGVPEKKVALL